jgi:two-component system response regulator LytT
MKILIADDETPARGELRYILESLAPEAKICEAANGAETLDLIEAEPFDVVFLDIHMPGLDGLAVASMLMEGPEPPLIVFATAYDEHALRAFELAALDYVVKPFSENAWRRRWNVCNMQWPSASCWNSARKPCAPTCVRAPHKSA